MSKGMWDLKRLMFLVQGGLCFYCWKPMSQEKEHSQAAHYATKDHLLPISHGGHEDWTNTILACLACNRLKANRLPTEAELARHGHYLALFNERVELRRAEIEAKESSAWRACQLYPAPATNLQPRLLCRVLRDSSWMETRTPCRMQRTAAVPLAAKQARMPDTPALVRDYDFPLPPELIAQAPPPERSGARMLTLDRATGAIQDRRFTELPSLLNPGDLLVLNNSRVLPARLFARRAGARPQPGQTPARIEVLLTEELTPGEWRALVRPARKALAGERLLFPPEGPPVLQAEITAQGDYGERTLRFAPHPDFHSALEALGEMPLPPYIRREASRSTPGDRERYQTVYARERGSVAAPTAGLHFTPEVLASLQARDVEIAHITLHVGLGTFQPVRVERLEEIQLHTERYTLPPETAEALNRTLAEGRRVVAAGTTTVRTLEHCAREAHGAPLAPHSGSTNIFLSPGHRFRIVRALLTNFHLPQSTLLMLVCAFAGFDPVMGAYRHAVAERYRFFSYGDCMFLA